MNVSGLVCPITKRPLAQSSADRLSTEDGQIFYRIENGLPILLGPEAITSLTPWIRNTKEPQYDEAYTEMEFYNSVAKEDARQIRELSLEQSNSAAIRHLGALAKRSEEDRSTFPDPLEMWQCDAIDIASERVCYRHIGPVKGKRIMQIGGKGSAAMLFLLAGAAEAILLTPMQGEALVAVELAAILGFSSRLRCVIGVAEEIPIADVYVDVCFSGGCVHHMRTDVSFSEISRILKTGGKFAAVEPWKAPGHVLGTTIFGKRERGIFCKPLTAERVAPFYKSFGYAECVRNGAITRYPAIVAQKAGLTITMPMARLLSEVDGAICKCVPFARHLGSGVALLGTK